VKLLKVLRVGLEFLGDLQSGRRLAWTSTTLSWYISGATRGIVSSAGAKDMDADMDVFAAWKVLKEKYKKKSVARTTAAWDGIFSLVRQEGNGPGAFSSSMML
jgi:hypothetical protein